MTGVQTCALPIFLSRNTTWTISRDTSLGLNFVGVNYYDGQGFMVPKKLNVKSARQLNGATVCVQPGTTTELNLADYFRANNMTFKPVVIEKLEEVLNAYFSGRCDVFTTDVSGLVRMVQFLNRLSSSSQSLIGVRRLDATLDRIRASSEIQSGVKPPHSKFARLTIGG